MILHRITDWEDAYTNGANIARGDRWPEIWVEPARRYREALTPGRARLDLAYGERPRNRLDLFLPEGKPAGLVVFVHGGYWVRFDKSYFSHLAAGPNAAGFAVAMPSYTLCPEVGIPDIVEEVAAAVSFAASLVPGPLHLCGHSAGGHLAARMVCADTPLSPEIRGRLGHLMSISGVNDLRPLMNIAVNAQLRLDDALATVQSPALLRPLPGVRITCWVGANERSEFIRQNALLANAWIGLGAATAVMEEPDRHHLNVIDGLAEPGHPMTSALLTA
ncbi:MAG: alpha/beta hydrolase [Rhizobiaceae bacterium]|nr:alpha/beta hydrolase [Rhizobiaceae bacterium]